MPSDTNWYFYDPDNNKPEPDHAFYCIRCHRSVKETQAVEYFHSVELHPIHPWCRLAAPGKGKYLIGSRCWDYIKKEFGPQNENE